MVGDSVCLCVRGVEGRGRGASFKLDAGVEAFRR